MAASGPQSHQIQASLPPASTRPRSIDDGCEDSVNRLAGSRQYALFTVTGPKSVSPRQMSFVRDLGSQWLDRQDRAVTRVVTPRRSNATERRMNWIEIGKVDLERSWTDDPCPAPVHP